MDHFSSQDGLALLLSGEHSDFKIICNGVEFNLHKIILQYTSPYFRAFINDWKESVDSTVNLDHDDPFIMASFLRYVYTGELSIVDTVRAFADKVPIPAAIKTGAQKENIIDVTSRLKHMVSLYAFAKMRQISSLQAATIMSIKSTMNQQDCFSDIGTNADKHAQMVQLVRHCLDEIEDGNEIYVVGSAASVSGSWMLPGTRRTSCGLS